MKRKAKKMRSATGKKRELNNRDLKKLAGGRERLLAKLEDGAWYADANPHDWNFRPRG